MFLIVGLGNPGEEYEHTRHNAGFDTVDKIASEIGVRYWKNECGALTGKGAYHDIDPGTIRVKFGGGHAGHNGLRSICDKLGTRDWFRVRCGIGRPPGRMPVADYVLSLPKKDAADDFAQATDLGCEAALFLIEHGLEKTQQKFN